MERFGVLVVLVIAVCAVRGGAAQCKPKQEMLNGECVKRCRSWEIRNNEGKCEKKCFQYAHLNENNACVCDEGYEKVKSRTCAKKCPENSRRQKGVGCVCKRGFIQDASGACVKPAPKPDKPTPAPCVDEFLSVSSITGGQIMHVKKCGAHYALPNKDAAAAVCQQHGMTLATPAQLQEGHSKGYSICACGWLSDGSAKFPIVGAAGGGCGTSDSINDCPADPAEWKVKGWNAHCVKRCEDVIKATQEIPSGKVMNIASCGDRYRMTTQAQAEELCRLNHAVLASPAQLTEAFNAGFSVCICGWLNDGSSKFPIKGPKTPGCGDANKINECPQSEIGKWAGIGWNAFCFQDKTNYCTDKKYTQTQVAGGVVVNIAECGDRYRLTTKDKAEALCKRNGGTLASPAQLKEAFDKGNSDCRCGWLSDGSAKFTWNAEARGGCGKAFSINDCPASGMGSWGGVGWNAYCYIRG